MKNKLILLALSCSLCFAANAQSPEEAANARPSEEEVLKPVGGDKTLEVSFYLAGGTTSQIKLRKFSTDNVAFRYGAIVGYDYQKLANGASSTDLLLSLVPGVEKHFAGTRRLSPYIGLTVPLSIRSRNHDSGQVETKGARDAQYLYERSYWEAGLNGVAGVDLYVVKNFYVGFEVGVGAAYQKYSDVETYQNNVLIEDRTVKGYGAFNVSTFTSGGLRLGFAF